MRFINKKFVLQTLFFILISSFLFSENVDNEFKLAIEDYKIGNFLSANERFLKLNEQYRENPEILYNVGNTYFKLGEIGKALLYLGMAQKYAPQDEDIQFNIKYISNQINDPDWKIGFFEKLNMNVIKLLLGILLLLLSVLLAMKILNKEKSYFWLILSTSFFTIIFLTLFLIKYFELKNIYGVCLSKDIGMRSGPSEEFNVNFTIPEGKKVKIMSESGNWYEIGMKSQGITGWIEKKHIGII